MASSWSPHKAQQHINLLELATVRHALEAWRHQSARIRIVIDNTSAAAQLRNQYSPVYAYNAELCRLQNVLKSKDITIVDVRYIRSEDNPAYWSRLVHATTSCRGQHRRVSTPDSYTTDEDWVQWSQPECNSY